MTLIKACSRSFILLALLLSAFAPGLPAAQADDDPPPPADGLDETALPTGGPSGIIPPFPTGCVGLIGLTGSNSTHQIINDFSTITSTIHLNTGTAGYNYLWDIKLTTDLTHTWNSDLDIHLISPAGTDVELSYRNGGDNDDVFFDTLWEDQAGRESFQAVPITDYVFPNFSVDALNPQEPLGVLRGENPNGDWKLVIHDVRAGDVGGLFSWKLNLSALKHAPDLTTSFITSSGPDPIPDGGQATESFNVPSYPDPLSAITVTTFISHSHPGDLNIFLITPTGITLTLSSGNGLTNTNVFSGTTWDDQAGRTNPPGPVTLNTLAPNVPENPLAPEESLSEMLGTSAGGVWQLKVVDTASNAISGTLVKATLGLHTAGCAPNLGAGISFGPGYPRLGQSATITFTGSNSSVTATNVSLTANLDPRLHFQSLSGPWTCNTPPVNTAGPTLNCTRPSLGKNAQANLVVTVTAPALLADVPVTLTVSFPALDTDPSNNTRVRTLPLFAHSANNQPWDFITTGSGAIDRGGQFAFNNFGQLRVAIDSLSDSTLTNFGLVPDATSQHWTTTTPQTLNGVQIDRQLYAPANQNWLRYVDTFHNTGSQLRFLKVAWGGYVGSYPDTDLVATSSGDLALTNDDVWAVIKKGPPGSASGTPPIGFVLRSPTDTSYAQPVIFKDPNIQAVWPPTGEDSLGHLYTFVLPGGATVRLAYFLYRGLAEGIPGPQDCPYYGGCITPNTGSQVSLAASTMAALAANPSLCDLTAAERGSLINWPGLTNCHDAFLPIITR